MNAYPSLTVARGGFSFPWTLKNANLSGNEGLRAKPHVVGRVSGTVAPDGTASTLVTLLHPFPGELASMRLETLEAVKRVKLVFSATSNERTVAMTIEGDRLGCSMLWDEDACFPDITDCSGIRTYDPRGAYRRDDLVTIAHRGFTCGVAHDVAEYRCSADSCSDSPGGGDWQYMHYCR